MRRASVRDLRTRTSELLQAAENGEVILIERRGRPVAELGPVTKRPRRIKFPDMTLFWNEFPRLSEDSTQDVSEDRDR